MFYSGFHGNSVTTAMSMSLMTIVPTKFHTKYDFDKT